VAGPVTYQRAPQAVFAGESLAQALRQLLVYGRDGLPVLSADGRQVQGWVTNNRVLRAIARQIHISQAQAAQAQLAADWALPDPKAALREPPTPLPGYQMLEISVEEDSPAAGTTLSAIAWPPGCTPAAILHGRTMRDPDPGVTLGPGDRVILLVSESLAERAAELPVRPADRPAASRPPHRPPHSAEPHLPAGRRQEEAATGGLAAQAAHQRNDHCGPMPD
jgi:CIC family chloride channel protein